ncbi:MAG: hypothetical protein JKY52_08470 [Flavobacteriales bacterium]|nr:hypothetical protein [Flavobacteriales bacterium]
MNKFKEIKIHYILTDIPALLMVIALVAIIVVGLVISVSGLISAVVSLF